MVSKTNVRGTTGFEEYLEEPQKRPGPAVRLWAAAGSFGQDNRGARRTHRHGSVSNRQGESLRLGVREGSSRNFPHNWVSLSVCPSSEVTAGERSSYNSRAGGHLQRSINEVAGFRFQIIGPCSSQVRDM